MVWYLFWQLEKKTVLVSVRLYRRFWRWCQKHAWTHFLNLLEHMWTHSCLSAKRNATRSASGETDTSLAVLLLSTTGWVLRSSMITIYWVGLSVTPQHLSHRKGCPLRVHPAFHRRAWEADGLASVPIRERQCPRSPQRLKNGEAAHRVRGKSRLHADVPPSSYLWSIPQTLSWV